VIGGFVQYVPPADPERAKLELELLEVVTRELLMDSRNSQETCFVAFGQASGGKWINPPDGFVERLSDLKRDIRPVLQARLPREGEIKFGRHRGVETMNSGQPASIYYVEIRKWIDEVAVEVDTGRYGGPLSGGSIEGAVYRRQGGNWTLVKEGQHFIH
jgi:hypothetical protein